MKKPALTFACLSLLIIGLTGCSDGEPEQASEPLTEEQALQRDGNRKARVCTGCHGPAGVSRIASIPSLAGKSQEYLAEQLRAFRSGERDNPTMTSIARSLTDEDIQALSHYYAGLEAPEGAN